MKYSVALSLILAANLIWAYPQPVAEENGVSLSVVGLDQGPKPKTPDWDRKKIGVKVFDAEADIPLEFAISNRTENAVSGRFSVWMNEDWNVSGAEEIVSIGAGEVQILKRIAKAKSSVLPALYPVHARFSADGFDLHPIAVMRVKSPNRAFKRAKPVRPSPPVKKHITEKVWQERTHVAESRAIQALRKGADEENGVYLLDDCGSSYGAGIAYGDEGLLDSVLAFSDGRNTITIRGFEVEVDGVRICQLSQTAALSTKVSVEKGALRIAWITSAHAHDGSPRITRVTHGPVSMAARRVYAGTGCVWEGLKKLTFRGSGFSLSTRHVGMDYPNGISLVEASSMPADMLEVDSENRLYRLVAHNDIVFSFVPSNKGAFDAAKRFAAVSGYRASAGLPAMKNRICIDDWSGASEGGYRTQASALRTAKRYGLDDVLYLQHNWQRWGYDARLPEVYPPKGNRAEFDDMVNAAKESGYLFGIHDNYVDFYPDAEGFSYRLFCYNEDGTPLEAWYSPRPRSLSYRWLPHAIHQRLKENLRQQREGFSPTAVFLDVFTASAANDVIDHTGRFHPHAECLAEWCRAWEECRETYGVKDAVTVSEAGSDSQIGYIDACECDHFDPRYQAFKSEFLDGERIPWHDVVTHGKLLLFGGGLGFRYSRVKPSDFSGNNDLHGWGTDDYLSTTVMGGRVPMAPSFSRATAKTYWMLHDVCGVLGQSELRTVEFVDDNIHRLHSVFSGGEVWVNRDTNSVWRLSDGRILPTYGFYAKVAEGAEAGIELIDGVRAGYAKSGNLYFVDARPVGVDDGVDKSVRSKAVSAEVCNDGRVVIRTVWEITQPIPEVYRPFTHVVSANGKGIAFHAPGVKLTPDQRVSVGRHETNIEVSVPKDVVEGEYLIMYGMYNPNGSRLPIGGLCDSENRVRGGVIKVERPEGQPMRIIWRKGGNTARDRELELNVDGKLVDFGGIKTDGAFRFNSHDLTVTPLPGSGPFRFEIDLSRYRAEGRRVGSVEMLSPQIWSEKPTWCQNGNRLSVECDGSSFAYQIKLN